MNVSCIDLGKYPGTCAQDIGQQGPTSGLPDYTQQQQRCQAAARTHRSGGLLPFKHCREAPHSRLPV